MASNVFARSNDRKKALKQLNKEVQSAILPDINDALNQVRSKSLNASKERKKKRIEYIHEERWDEKANGKWTFFNKHAVEIEEDDSSHSDRGFGYEEDNVLE